MIIFFLLNVFYPFLTVNTVQVIGKSYQDIAWVSTAKKYLRIFPCFADTYLLIDFLPYQLAFPLFCFVYLCCFIQKKYLPSFLCLWVPLEIYLLMKILLSPALHLGLVAFFCHRIQRHLQNGYSRETTACFYKAMSPGSCEETIVLVNWIRPKDLPRCLLLSCLDLFPWVPWFTITRCSRFYSS